MPTRATRTRGGACGSGPTMRPCASMPISPRIAAEVDAGHCSCRRRTSAPCLGRWAREGPGRTRGFNEQQCVDMALPDCEGIGIPERACRKRAAEPLIWRERVQIEQQPVMSTRVCPRLERLRRRCFDRFRIDHGPLAPVRPAHGTFLPAECGNRQHLQIITRSTSRVIAGVERAGVEDWVVHNADVLARYRHHPGRRPIGLSMKLPNDSA